MLTNYHTHTKRCHHAAEVPDEDYVISAVKAGFAKLAFTDHVPFPVIPYPEDQQSRMDYAQLDEYLASVTALKVKYQDQIEILSGFELEFYPAFLDYYRELKAKTDILIVGQHNPVPLIRDYGIYNRDEDVLLYGRQVTEAIESGIPDIIAHPDYFLLGRSAWTAACEQAAHQICAASARCQIPLELNLNGLRYGKKLINDQPAYAYPYPAFWKIASQYQCTAIYGFDAHHPDTLQEFWRIETVREILEGIDLKLIDDLNRR
ncbi:hypothetical protein SDC9_112212 [bioreactor metagenome]|uniref:histidinol-phosphatase n=1 Tax=bioreactor metagenome TaxID=1076179 RepID=A0A645BIY0_9ZZZZ